MKNLQTIFTLSALIASAQAKEKASCGDRQIWTNGDCQECPTWTRSQSDHQYCNSDQCDHKTQVVKTDGTCASCPDGFEPDVNMVDCNKIGLVCEGNMAKSGSKCIECPLYTKPQSNNSYCSPDYCDSNSIVLPTGKCEKCPTGQKPDLIQRRKCVVDKRNQECNGRQIELKDHAGLRTCQDCPDYTRAQEQNWYCAADMCDFNQIVRKDGTCLSCPRNETPDASRLKCKTLPKPTIIGEKEPVAAPKVVAVKVEEEQSGCQSDWQITLKDGKCVACPAFTKPTQNNDCQADICNRNEYLHEWGYCLPCQKGWVHDRTGRKCVEGGLLLANFEPLTCGDREHRSLDGLECFQCPDYTRAQDKNTRCGGDDCKIFQIQKLDGTCHDCPQGSRSNFMKRQCVKIVSPDSCTARQVYVEVMNMCEQCPEFSRPQGDHCAPDQCADNQTVQKDGTCGQTSCSELEILGQDGVTCEKCFPYTRAQDDGKRCGQDHCPKGIVQWDGTCMKYGQYLTNFKVDKPTQEAPVAQESEVSGNDNASVAVISVLSTVILGLIAFIAFQFRSGSKQLPPSPQVNEVSQAEVSQVQELAFQSVEVGPTAKKLMVEESFDKIDEEVPQENIQNSVKVPIAAEE